MPFQIFGDDLFCFAALFRDLITGTLGLAGTMGRLLLPLLADAVDPLGRALGPHCYVVLMRKQEPPLWVTLVVCLYTGTINVVIHRVYGYFLSSGHKNNPLKIKLRS